MSSRKLVFNFSDWLHEYHCSIMGKQSIEIYAFINPLCPHAWGLEPILKKLQLEYGKHINIKHILSGNITHHSALRQRQLIQNEQPLFKQSSRASIACREQKIGYHYTTIPYNASIAIKAAELQGKKHGIRFMRKLQQFYFLKKKDISSIDVIIECAKAVKLDIVEFQSDITSQLAAKALQSDIKVAEEMDVQETPTLVFFNEKTEEEGIKVSGIYSYDIYKSILSEIMPSLPEPSPLPTIEAFVRFYQIASSSEIAAVYNMSTKAVDCEMRHLINKGVVQKIPSDHGYFWKYKQAE